MSKPLNKQALVTTAWIAALRTQGHRKCTGELKEGTRVCALGLLCEVAGIKTPAVENGSWEPLVRATGLTEEQLGEVWHLNDGVPMTPHKSRHKHSFAEIADIVEGFTRG